MHIWKEEKIVTFYYIEKSSSGEYKVIFNKMYSYFVALGVGRISARNENFYWLIKRIRNIEHSSKKTSE